MIEANPGRVNDTYDDAGHSPLYVAALLGSVPLVVWMLDEKGADLNGFTANHCKWIHFFYLPLLTRLVHGLERTTIGPFLYACRGKPLLPLFLIKRCPYPFNFLGYSRARGVSRQFALALLPKREKFGERDASVQTHCSSQFPKRYHCSFLQQSTLGEAKTSYNHLPRVRYR